MKTCFGSRRWNDSRETIVSILQEIRFEARGPGNETDRVWMLTAIRLDEAEEANWKQEGGGTELLITECV